MNTDPFAAIVQGYQTEDSVCSQLSLSLLTVPRQRSRFNRRSEIIIQLRSIWRHAVILPWAESVCGYRKIFRIGSLQLRRATQTARIHSTLVHNALNSHPDIAHQRNSRTPLL